MAVNNEMITLEGGGPPEIPAPAGGGHASSTTSSMPITGSMEVGVAGHHAHLDDNQSVMSDDEMGVRHCFYDFCKQTILHGWHYLADLENDATPSPSFVTFTPVSSPNTALAGKRARVAKSILGCLKGKLF